MSFERYLSVRVIKWRTSYFKTKEAFILSIFTGLILSIINVSFVSLIDYDTNNNETCLVDDIYSIEMRVSKLFQRSPILQYTTVQQ